MFLPSDYRDHFRKLLLQTLRHYSRKYSRSGEYRINCNFYQVVEYMLDNQKTSIIDLGCGMGHCLEMCRRLGMKVKGIELDQALIDAGYDFVKYGDLRRLEKSELIGFDVIYSYGPFMNDEMNSRFIQGLLSIKAPNQVILHYGKSDKNFNLYE